MALVTLTYPLTDNTTAFGSQVRANDDAIVAQVNGGLEDINIKAGAAISGQKLSNVPGSRIPTDRVEDLSITTAKVADAAVTNAKLGPLAVTKDKLTTAGGQKITLAQLEMTATPGALAASAATQFSGSFNVASNATADAFPGLDVTPVNVAGNWQFRVMASWIKAGTNTVFTFAFNVDPNAVGIGTQPSTVSSKDDLRANASAQGGDASLVQRGLTFGKLVDGGDVGKFKAQYRKVSGQGGVSQYRVPHSLGVVPAFCLLVACDNPSSPGTIISAAPASFDKWTGTECRVNVVAHVGNVQGAAMWFLVGGER